MRLFHPPLPRRDRVYDAGLGYAAALFSPSFKSTIKNRKEKQSMNQLIITGHLGDDVKDFFTPDGVAISTFPMAFRSGKDKTSWIRVSCYNKLAELATKCLHKGAVTLHINLMSIFHICLMFCKNIIGIGFMGHLVSDRSYPQPSFRPPCFVPGLRSVVGHG
jgi:hypothetical protein